MRERLTRIVVCLLPALLVMASTGLAAEVRGTVSASGSLSKKPSRYVTRGAATEAPSTDGGSAMVAVALESLDHPTPLIVPDTPFVMAQENTAFVPDLMVVPVGATVTFPNRDAFFHNVFSYSPPRNFDLGRYPKGETRTVTFEMSGIVRLFCEIHASMFASIAVVNTNRSQIVPAGSEFVFTDVEPGRYRLLAIDARGRRGAQEITVGEQSARAIAMTLE